MPGLLAREPIAPTEDERDQLRAMVAILQDRRAGRAQLLAPDGSIIPVPESILRVLMQAAHAMVQGKAVAIMPSDRSVKSNGTRTTSPLR